MTIQKELIPLRPGDVLRYERQQRGLSVEQAASQSRIKQAIIDAIESGETGDIPAVYLKGHIRHYARFLGVDPRDLDTQMEQVHGAEPEVRSIYTVTAKRNRGDRWLKASSYLAASALIATLAWQFTHEAVRLSQGEAQQAPGTMVAEEGRQSSGAEEKATPRSPNRHLNASIASVEMLDKDAGPAVEPVGEQAWAALSGETAPKASGLLSHNLLISTSADTWVEIFDARGEQMEMDLIRAGSRREYEGRAPFSVMIGRASAVELALDGQAVDLGPFTRGNVARLTLGSQ
jgi:cytoskeleton protein RodZ